MRREELPRGVAAVITQPADLDRIPPGVGAIEIRADLFPSAEEALAAVSSAAKRFPVIFTLRRKEEGGAYAGSESERTRLYERAHRQGATLLDAEWGSEAARELHRRRLPLLLSHHDFAGMLEVAALERATREMEEYHPAAIKLVPTARKLADAVRMLEWVSATPPGGVPRIGFAMGEEGVVSRVLCVARGAPFTYGAAGAAVAPGQPSARELVELYRADKLGRTTRCYGVVGNPVRHSLSPHLHNPAFEREGLDAVYVPFLVETLAEFTGLWQVLGLQGLSVTIPFKEDACRLAADLDARSRACGAANTLVVVDWTGAGTPVLKAYNTDYDGVLQPLRGRIGGLEGLSVAILGNGGAARGAARALIDAGASVTFYSRNLERGRAAARALGIRARPLEALERGAHRVIINATPLGMQPGDPSPVPDRVFTPETIAFDMVYDPPVTAFLEAARSAGADVIPGGEMLVAQALTQFRLFTGREADPEGFSESFRAALEGRRNQERAA